MSTLRVEFSPEALDHVERAVSWWQENRPAAPTLFRDELAAAVRTLESSSAIGSPYLPMPSIRRLMMARCRYHLYYRVDEAAGVVQVRAVWHCSRGSAPPL